MKNLFNIDNAFKVLVVLLLSVMAFGANAASLGGSIGYGSCSGTTYRRWCWIR